MKTRLVIGPPVRGEDLWNRKREIDEIWNVLETGHILLAAPRRLGKTSIMLNIRDVPRDGYRTFYLDTEWIRDPVDFIAELAAELLNDSVIMQILSQVGGLISNIINRIQGISVKEVFKVELREQIRSSRDWHDEGKQLISHLKDCDGIVVIIVDEFCLMIKRMLRDDPRKAMDFLYWMRGIRQNPEPSNLRFIFGGSIGIEHVLKQASTGTKVINDLRRIQIGAFSDKEARQFIKVLLQNETGRSRILGKTINDFMGVLETPIPFFIQIMVTESIKEAEYQKKPLSLEVIQRAYNERVLSSYNRTYFEHYYTRLKEYYDEEDEKLAKALLLEIAKREAMSGSDLWALYQNLAGEKANGENFSYLLSDLENDFYIHFDPSRQAYRFATRVLRDWWLRHHSIAD
jgi:hypothetical protein